MPERLSGTSPATSRGGVDDYAHLAFAGLLAAVFLLFAFADGGFAPTVWLPATMFLLVLAAMLVVLRPELVRGLSTPSRLAIVLLGGYAGWSYLSMAWADAPADAWTGANRTLLYLAIFTLYSLWPWRPAHATALLGAFVFAAVASGMLALVRAAAADEPLDFFFGSRFSEPMGYHNATAAFLTLAFWPALFLASQRRFPLLVRASYLAAATVLLELSVVPQSRGWAVAFVVALGVYFVVVPHRLRALVHLVPPVVATLLVLDRLLDVFHAAGLGEPNDALASAGIAVGASAAAVALVGLGLALLDRRLQLPPRLVRGTGLVLLGGLALAFVVGVALVARADPATRLGDAWDEFRAGEPTDASASHFQSGVGSNRYDGWRVALHEFRAAPLQGIGADNFEIPYLQQRRTIDEPRFPHSLELQVLSQTGLVGGALFVGFVATALVAALRARRRSNLHASLASVLLVMFAYWAVHGSVDWFWEFPALAGTAIGALGLAGALGRGPLAPADDVSRSVTAARTAIVGIASVGVIACGIPWLAERYVQAGLGAWRNDPDAAFDSFDRARRLNPLSARPDLLAGAVAARRSDWTGMRAAFSRALERDPTNWYAELELAVVDGVEGHRRSALTHLRRAEELNPREPVIGLVRRRLERGQRIDPSAVDRLFLDRLRERGL